VLAGLLGAVAGALGAGAAPADARCRDDGHRCGNGSDCCSGFCLDYDPVTRHRDVCATCPPATIPCNNSCVPACPDGQTMAEDCTCGCAATCPPGQSLDGACACLCDQSGEPPCGDVCCEVGVTCLDGQCKSASGGTCAGASRCGERHYCNEEQTCICVESVDGDLRCGRLPTTCHAQLCETNADCANLGEGYFCDTPHSGCCTDPPAELSRCIAPCETPVCPAERDCDDTCCPADQICSAGACVVPCETTDDCGADTCVDGVCVPNTSCDGSGCLGGRCGGDEDYCLCTSSVEGTGVCLDAFKADCDLYTPCSASSECDGGLCLATADCCGGRNLCVPASAACPS
jgi:hypothetical protein